MKYVIKDMIGYVGESLDQNWSKLVKTKEEAKKFDTKEEAEQYSKAHFGKKGMKYQTIEEIE